MKKACLDHLSHFFFVGSSLAPESLSKGSPVDLNSSGQHNWLRPMARKDSGSDLDLNRTQIDIFLGEGTRGSESKAGSSVEESDGYPFLPKNSGQVKLFPEAQMRLEMKKTLALAEDH